MRAYAGRVSGIRRKAWQYCLAIALWQTASLAVAPIVLACGMVTFAALGKPNCCPGMGTGAGAICPMHSTSAPHGPAPVSDSGDRLDCCDTTSLYGLVAGLPGFLPPAHIVIEDTMTSSMPVIVEHSRIEHPKVPNSPPPRG